MNFKKIADTIFNLDKNWIDLASMLQHSNDQIMIFFGNQKNLLQIHKRRLFSRIKLFEVGTCLNCLSLVNMIQYIKLVWKRKIYIIFNKDQTNLQKQIELIVGVENDPYFCKQIVRGSRSYLIKTDQKSLKKV